MNLADIQEIEDRLDVELPAPYKEVLLNYPAVFEKDGYASEFTLVNSPGKLIKLNEDWGNILDLELDPSEIVIGESGCGDYYIIDTDDEDPDVRFWNHEIREFSDDERSESLAEYVGKIMVGVRCGIDDEMKSGSKATSKQANKKSRRTPVKKK